MFRIRSIARTMPAFVAVSALAVGVSACASDAGTPSASTSASYTAIIDVRTAAEFAEGHVPDSLNFDVLAPAFASQISTLDPSGTYLVYCRSGNRTKAATGQMKDIGLTVIDGGGLADMESTGWTFVR
jgi:phage shock protein E